MSIVVGLTVIFGMRTVFDEMQALRGSIQGVQKEQETMSSRITEIEMWKLKTENRVDDMETTALVQRESLAGLNERMAEIARQHRNGLSLYIVVTLGVVFTVYVLLNLVYSYLTQNVGNR